MMNCVILGDGRHWVSGGSGIGGNLASSEIYDPISRTWTQGPELEVETYVTFHHFLLCK